MESSHAKDVIVDDLRRRGVIGMRDMLVKAAGLLLFVSVVQGQDASLPAAFPLSLPANLPVLPVKQQAAMDRDLMEVTIPQLQALYARHRYTVEQVTRWYIGRIARYNGIYRSVQTVDVEGALGRRARSFWASRTCRTLRRAIRIDRRRSGAPETRMTSASLPADRRAER